MCVTDTDYRVIIAETIRKVSRLGIVKIPVVDTAEEDCFGEVYGRVVFNADRR